MVTDLWAQRWTLYTADVDAAVHTCTRNRCHRHLPVNLLYIKNFYVGFDAVAVALTPDARALVASCPWKG